MIEIRYGDYYEVADMAGQSVDEAREQFKGKLGIPDNTQAKLNGKNVKGKLEPEIMLNDDDELSFAKARGRGVFLLAALLVALAATGGVFAYGFTSGSTSFSVSTGGGLDFVNVTSNSSVPISWTLYGNSVGSTSNGTLFDIDTATSNYTGDIAATIYLKNLDTLAQIFTQLAMKLVVYDSSGNLVDLNGDSSANISSDFAFLPLNRGSADLYIPGAADVFTVWVDRCVFIVAPYDANWTIDQAVPQLYIDILPR